MITCCSIFIGACVLFVVYLFWSDGSRSGKSLEAGLIAAIHSPEGDPIKAFHLLVNHLVAHGDISEVERVIERYQEACYNHTHTLLESPKFASPVKLKPRGKKKPVLKSQNQTTTWGRPVYHAVGTKRRGACKR